MTKDERALRFYSLAWSVLRTNGRLMVFGSTQILVWRRGPLTIRYWPEQRLLDVWHGSKVLAVERLNDDPDVVHYTPGNWERELEAAAKLSAEVRKGQPPNIALL
jgi:hypothetical protein